MSKFVSEAVLRAALALSALTAAGGALAQEKPGAAPGLNDCVASAMQGMDRLKIQNDGETFQASGERNGIKTSIWYGVDGRDKSKPFGDMEHETVGQSGMKVSQREDTATLDLRRFSVETRNVPRAHDVAAREVHSSVTNAIKLCMKPK